MAAAKKTTSKSKKTPTKKKVTAKKKVPVKKTAPKKAVTAKKKTPIKKKVVAPKKVAVKKPAAKKPVVKKSLPTPTGQDSFTLIDNSNGKSYTYPVLHGTQGPRAVDVRKFYGDTDAFLYDPSFTSTASCDSKITFIDGDKGVLQHRGYPINELAEKASFLEVSFLLLYGELPNKSELEQFEHEVTMHTLVHERLKEFYQGFPRNAHPMAIMCGTVGALSAFYHDSVDFHDPYQRELTAIRLMAKMPTIAAMSYKYAIGQPFIYPDNTLDYSSNFLKMMFAVPCEEYKVDPVVAKAMDKIFILHADHEQNASTSTVRLAGSSNANPFACISAGIASLWGPSHGGANEAVIHMLEEIGDKKNISAFIKKVKNRETRLMGFGHRVYKNYDPRAAVMQKACKDVLKSLKIKDPHLEIAMELERIALSDDFFVEKKLYPNVDFYSGIILRAIGFPTSMFTVLFALARTVGWISQWKEMDEDPAKRIGRPRQLYVGEKQRKVTPIKKRSRDVIHRQILTDRR